jgi:alpha-amylase/alpha-mannosidase (GH57 family)
MGAKELTLNIAVNLGRLGRWAGEGRINRVNQFLAETEEYINQLERIPKSLRFSKTFDAFHKSFNELKTAEQFDLTWQEMMFTWANILTHRASLNAS